MTFAYEMKLKTKAVAKNIRFQENVLLEMLITMKKRSCFQELGYQGVWEFCVEELEQSESQAYNYKKLIETVEVVPELRESLDRGDVSISQARRLVPVINSENHDRWIANAQNMKQKDLELAVQKENPNARIPRETIKVVAPELLQVCFNVTPEEAEDLRKIQDLLSKKQKHCVTLQEAVRQLSKEWLEDNDPVLRAEKLSSRKQRELPPQPPGRQPLRTSLKHQIAQRDEGRCTFTSEDGKRCGARRFTENHHMITVAQGGLNELPNITTLCSSHHRFLHDRKGPGTRTSPP